MENKTQQGSIIQVSVFSNGVLIPIFFSLLTTLLLPATIWYIFTSGDVYDILGGIIAFIFIFLIWIVMVWGELRLKAVKIYFKGTVIEVYPFLGLGKKQTYSYDQIESFDFGLQPAYPLPYECITLISNQQDVVRISQFYFRNYQEMKFLVTGKFKDYKIRKFNLRKAFREIFESR